ncbi:serine/threonine protein kinase [Piscinibacter sp.]|jgi:Ser/Thr protein kinase RdoA (MazF antagonist)|uniref:serine/threonine protein kinase n=1 Tax=Piscinibacter sp. TaxID=1903157 RepID=UPI0035599CAB
MTPPDIPPASRDTPYAGLKPEVVLDALDGVGLRGDGRMLQLNSYENRVFQVFLEDGRVVVTKFYRPGRWSDEQILEEHEFTAELAADEIPVVAPWVLSRVDGSALTPALRGEPPTLAEVVTRSGAYRFAVAPRRAGRAPELDVPATLEWIGRFIGRMHAVGSRKPFRFRRALSVAEFGWAARDWIREHRIVPPDAAAPWERAAEHALALAEQAFERAGPVRQIRLHGDCHVGNVLWTDAGPHFVDLDDALTGPAVQDLWMLLSGDSAAYRQQLRALLTGYEAFMDFDDRELTLIEPLRTLRIVHHSAWLAKRWNDPAFPAAFPWFTDAAYWQQQAQLLQECVARMQDG